jgi:amidase
VHELLQLSAIRQAEAIRSRQISSEELVRAHLERIAAVNPALKAVVQLDPAASLESARAADQRLAAGDPPGPFHGIPFTAKDWLETADFVCAGGFVERRDYRPKRDATVVARMRAAGAILVGKTNVQEANPVYGATRNPWDPARSPGASTSGEAAIIAACGSPAGLGSDSGGSLRYPAHCCGVATLKPTTGRVPNTGHFPRIGALHDPRTVIGPLSRHVEDLLPILSVIAGVDWRDPSVVPAPLEQPAAGVDGRRVGWFVEMPGAEPDDATRIVIRNAAAALADAGALVEEVTLPRVGEAMSITKTYWRRVQSRNFSEWAADKPSTLTADEIERHNFEWDRLRRDMLAFIEPYTAILCPVAEGPAPRHGAILPESYVYTLPFSLTGWPVVVLPAGASPEGLPVGVQVVARPWDEGDAVAVAAAIESALGGWKSPPLAAMT